MSRVLFFPPTINGETEWISPKEDIMFQSLSELLGAYQKRDPAARSKLEIFLLYPASTPSSSTASPTGSTVTTFPSWPA